MSSFSVSFDDPTGAYTKYYDELRTTFTAAGEYWSRHVPGSGSIELEVRFDPSISTIASAASSSVASGQIDGKTIYQQGVASEMMTGVDPNGTAPDAVTTIGASYLDQLWFDPHPMSRSAPVDPGKVDALSVFMHEIGHMIALNGWKDATGALPGTYESTFDAHTALLGSGLAFTGPAAEAAYGGPVPLSRFATGHLGNPGDAAASDLMNGVAFVTGTRYDISALDLAVLKDCGVSVRDAVGQAPAETGSNPLQGAPASEDFDLRHDMLRHLGAKLHHAEARDAADGTHLDPSDVAGLMAALHLHHHHAHADAWLGFG